MKNKILLVLSFVAAFILATPVSAAPPEGEGTATEAKEPAPDAKVDEKADVKVEEKTDAKADAKVEEKKAAEPAPEIKTDEEAVGVVNQVVGAAKEGKWGLVAGLVIMLLVYGIRRVGLLSKVPAQWIPWVAAGLSIVGYIAGALMVDGATIVDALVGGFTVGASAAGLWEMLFKHILPAQKTA
jgi:hypothetical protein